MQPARLAAVVATAATVRNLKHEWRSHAEHTAANLAPNCENI
jgi:hypothetical protein